MTHHTIIKSSLAIAVAFLAASFLLRQLDSGAVEIIAEGLGVLGLVTLFVGGIVSVGHRDHEDRQSSGQSPDG